jgi:hypothetical protein
LALGSATADAAAPDAIVRWNVAITDHAAQLDADPATQLPPFLESRAFAMAHVAMLDALKHVERDAGPVLANADAAIAAAAHGVLAAQFGFGPASVSATYAAEVAAIPDGPAKARGIAFGQAAAARMNASRADEDVLAAITAPYAVGTGPGEYQPTPPLAPLVAAAGWSALRTFVVRDSTQFRAPKPYATLQGLEYAMDVNEIQALGAAGSAGRTKDQTAIAFFWYENSSIAWNRIARGLSADQTRMHHARLFAAVNAALSDAYSTALESKFHYRLWRPITAIRAAASDGNPLTVPDPAWQPAFVTPPVPDYPSAHAAAGGAAAEVITLLVGAKPFTHASTTGGIAFGVGAIAPPYAAAIERSYPDALAAARENAFSRMLVGIHFRAACHEGLVQGRTIGRYVVDRAKFLLD